MTVEAEGEQKRRDEEKGEKENKDDVKVKKETIFMKCQDERHIIPNLLYR